MFPHILVLVAIASAIASGLWAIGFRYLWRRGKSLEDL